MDICDDSLKLLALVVVVIVPLSGNDLLDVLKAGVTLLETWVIECDAPKLSRNVLIISRYCF